MVRGWWRQGHVRVRAWTGRAGAHLGEEVVHHVRANVVVDLVEDAVVAVNGGQAAAEVAPLLRG